MYTDMYVTSFCDCQVDTHRVMFECDCYNIYRGSSIQYNLLLPEPYTNYSSFEVLFVQNENIIVKQSLENIKWDDTKTQGLISLPDDQTLLFTYGIDCKVYAIMKDLEGNTQIQNPFSAHVLNPQYLSLNDEKE